MSERETVTGSRTAMGTRARRSAWIAAVALAVAASTGGCAPREERDEPAAGSGPGGAPPAGPAAAAEAPGTLPEATDDPGASATQKRLERLRELCRAYRTNRNPATRRDVEMRYEDLAIEHLADGIAEGLARETERLDRELRLAVLDLEPAGGGASAEGAEWASRIATRLVGQPRLVLVERKDLSAVHDELAASRSDLMDAATSVRLGKLLGADAILRGELGSAAVVRVIDVESGRLLAAVDAPRPYVESGRAAPQDVVEQFVGLKSRDDPFGLEVSTDRSEYAIDDAVTFRFRAARDCWVTLLSVQSDGTLVQLFPNPYSDDGRITAGRDYLVPPADAEWEIAVTPPAGTQWVKAIASSRELPAFEGGSVDEFRSEADLAAGFQRVRDLAIRLKRPAGFQWGTAEWKFAIRR